jgi:hypothetical protein
MIVKLLRARPPLNPGERANFEDHIANGMITRGDAVCAEPQAELEPETPAPVQPKRK